jgi:hypothetical protein
MPSKFIGFDTEGKHRWVRLPYVAAQYTVPPGTIDTMRQNSESYGSRELLNDYGGPFHGLVKVREFQRDGKPFLLLFSPGGVEWAVEVELTDHKLGEIRAVAPEEAWKIARELDAKAPNPVPVEGEGG